MSKEVYENKYNAYFGFAKKKRSIYVGMKLEEMIKEHKIALVIFLSECSEKSEAHLCSLIKDDSVIKTIRYEGFYDIKNALGFDLLKAIGIKDVSLANAIYNTMREEQKEKEDNK